jgi:hypothetical protein
MVMVAAGGVKGGKAMGAARVGFEVGGDGELDAAGAAKDSWFVPFGLGPGFDRVAGQGVVAVFASVEVAAALHFDGDDVESGMVMKAASLWIEMEAADFGSGWRHWMSGGSGRRE